MVLLTYIYWKAQSFALFSVFLQDTIRTGMAIFDQRNIPCFFFRVNEFRELVVKADVPYFEVLRRKSLCHRPVGLSFVCSAIVYKQKKNNQDTKTIEKKFTSPG